jgi:hypothetical protein
VALCAVVFANALVPHQPSPAPPLAPHVAFAVARLPPVADWASLLAEKLCLQPEPSLPWQEAPAMAFWSVVFATALVPHHPLPAPPLAPHVAFAVARLPAVAD